MTKLGTVLKKQALVKSNRREVKPTKDRKGGRLTKAMWKYILKDANEMIETGEYDNLTILQLANRWNVSKHTIPRIREVIGVRNDLLLPFIEARFLKRYELLEQDLDEMHNDLRKNKYHKTDAIQ